MSGSKRDRHYEEGDHWYGANGENEYASGEFGDDEPPVKIPEIQVKRHDKAIIASAVGLLGLGLTVGTIATVKHVKHRKQGE